MSWSTIVNNKLVRSDIDKEDIVYLQESLVSILYNTERDMYTNANPADWCKDSGLLRSSFGLQHNPSFDKTTHRVNGFESMSSSSGGSESDCVYLPSRQNYDAATLFGDILNKGIDREDIEYIRRGFNCCLWDSKERNWTTKVCWDCHPPTVDATAKCIFKISDDFSFNKTGCARSEGYFKVNKLYRPKIKNVQRQLQPHTTSSVEVSKGLYGKIYKGNKQSLSRDARNYQRRLSTAYQTITDSDLLKLNELKFRKKKLALGKSEIHGLGVFAKEFIDPNEIIIEYVGQIIRPIIADIREHQYRSSGIGSYCFRLGDNTIIDATKYGNLNRYINHSCNPNSYSKILHFDNQKKIVIYSKKAIQIDEEITYDYKLPLEDDKIFCLCRSPGCRKSLN